MQKEVGIKMKKEVMICMSGVMAADSEGAVDIICLGEYYFRNGKHFIRYEEKIAEDSQTTDTVCMFKFDAKSAELTKKGIVSSKLFYEPGQTHRISYATEYGDFLIGLKTDALRLTESEHELILEIDYVIEFESDEKNVFHIKIHVSDEPERLLP